MLPLLVGLGAVYAAGRAYDNLRYWNDYYHRTGYRPRYPFMRGSMDYLKVGSAFKGVKKM